MCPKETAIYCNSLNGGWQETIQIIQDFFLFFLLFISSLQNLILSITDTTSAPLEVSKPIRSNKGQLSNQDSRLGAETGAVFLIDKQIAKTA